MPWPGPTKEMLAMLAALLVLHLPHLAWAASKVRVDFYGEALCPFCVNFTQTQLHDMMKDPSIASMIELDYIPYGNAKQKADGAFVCQHGPRECDLNRLLSCAMAAYPYTEAWFPFVDCVEGAAESDKEASVEDLTAHCAPKAGLVKSKVLDCYKGELGDELQRRAAERTNDLVPRHQYVPWVVVNDIPLLDDFENVLKYVCVAYHGDRPKACFQAPPTKQVVARQRGGLRTCPHAAAGLQATS